MDKESVLYHDDNGNVIGLGETTIVEIKHPEIIGVVIRQTVTAVQGAHSESTTTVDETVIRDLRSGQRKLKEFKKGK